MNNQFKKYGTWSRIFGLYIFLANVIYFIQLTLEIYNTPNGPEVLSLFFLPVSVSINLLLIPAVLTLRKQLAENLWVFVTLLLGCSWTLFWSVLFS